jgi:protein TonB
MFEDSLVESQGRLRTKSRWFAIGSLLGQAALLLLLMLYPLVHPQALPKQSMERLLVAPPPPRPPAPVQARAASTPAARQPTLQIAEQFTAPGRIPTHIAMIEDQGPPSTSPIGETPGGNQGSIPEGIDLGAAVAPVIVARAAVPKRPLAVSSGVAAGQLLEAIRPIYPAIAKTTRTQGTVVLEATISRQGTIENVRVVDGPQLLRQAAIDAVAAAHYRPFLLNGEPVEVQTSINIIFSLGE